MIEILPCSCVKHRRPELILLLGSRPAGGINPEPGGRLSGVTERLGALGHIDTRGPSRHHEPYYISFRLNARPKGLTAVLHTII